MSGNADSRPEHPDVGRPAMAQRRRSLASLTSSERRLMVRALTTVARIRVALWAKRFASIRSQIVDLEATAPAALDDLRQIAWSVTATAKLVPQATCLTQALAGQTLLAQRGLASTVQLSISQNTGTDLRPHAWLLSDDIIVLGGTRDEYVRHRPLADYSSAVFAASTPDFETSSRPQVS